MNKSERRIRIVNLLKEERMSSKEIAEKLGIETNLVSPIISELKKRGEIHTISTGKHSWGIRHENGQNEFLIKKYEWVKLEKYELKVFYKDTYPFFCRTEDGECYYENHSIFEFHRDHKVLMPIEVYWQDIEKGKEKEVLTEVNTGEEIIRINLIYRVVSKKSIKLKIQYERTEIILTESERKAIKEKETEVKKQIINWMEEKFK